MSTNWCCQIYNGADFTQIPAEIPSIPQNRTGLTTRYDKFKARGYPPGVRFNYKWSANMGNAGLTDSNLNFGSLCDLAHYKHDQAIGLGKTALDKWNPHFYFASRFDRSTRPRVDV